MQVTSAEFQQDIGRYQDAAQQAPVVHDVVSRVLIRGLEISLKKLRTDAQCSSGGGEGLLILMQKLS